MNMARWGLLPAVWLAILSAPGMCGTGPVYTIEATLDTRSHRLSARQAVEFTNESDKDLAELYFNIYPRRKYERREIKFLKSFAGYFKVDAFPAGFQQGDLAVTSVTADGIACPFYEEGENRTLLKVALPRPLKPGERATVEMDFNAVIPHAYGRFGWHNGITALNRWYPILCVFDGDQWEKYPCYLYHRPYHSQAALYRVALTVDTGETIASTGVARREQARPDGSTTVFFETEHPVRDFSLCVSRKFRTHVLRRGNTDIIAYYLPGDRRQAETAAESAGRLMDFYSSRFGEYPYSTFSIVPCYLGYGGEQSACLISVDTRVYKLPGFLRRYFEFLIAHETGHQWFYNMIGTDEYKEMFLEEGMNSFWVLRYLEDRYGRDAKVLDLKSPASWLVPNFSFRQSSVFRYIYMAKNGMDRSVVGPLSGFNEPSSIFAITYGKGAAVLEMLCSLIGEDAFAKTMRRYSADYRFRNAGVGDFIRIAEEESAADLDWFFNQWLNTKKTCDYAVKAVTRASVTIERKGEILMPCDVRITYSDGGSETRVWDGNGSVLAVPVSRPVRQVELDPDKKIVLDLDLSNNTWPRRFSFTPVALYSPVYEIPVLAERGAYCIFAGPSVGGSSAGLAGSIQKPFTGSLRASSVYDANGKAFESRLAYEVKPVINSKTSAGAEVFNYDSRKEGHDVEGGMLYLRRELKPAALSVFEDNDHVMMYLLRDQKLEPAGLSGGTDPAQGLRYRKKKETIAGVSGILGFCGPASSPEFGWRVIPLQEIAGHFLGGTEAFWRSRLEVDAYRLVIPSLKHTVAARAQAGWGTSDKVLFQLGGPKGLRGYDLKTIDGSRFLLGGLEYRFPLVRDINRYWLDNFVGLEQIQTVAFVDAGKAWFSDYSLSHWKRDAGLGFRIHLHLLGLVERTSVRIDGARPLGDREDDDWRFWLGINQAF